jgi:two-component system chemotaxis response regulator CheY
MPLDPATPILVVDDYKAVRRIVRCLLVQSGFTDVDEAGDGAEALAKMKEKKYGLVLSDWYMDPTSGMDLLAEAKADADLRETPFIMISADAAPDNLATAREAGACGYIVKPFDAETLRDRIELACAA